jgi:hypothetical protein
MVSPVLVAQSIPFIRQLAQGLTNSLCLANPANNQQALPIFCPLVKIATTTIPKIQ